MKSSLLILSFCFIVLQAKSQVMHPEKQLQEMGIVLGEVKAPVANYVKAVQTGNLLFLSGHIPDEVAGKKTRGKVGSALTVDEAKEAARLTGIALLTTLKAYVGDLNRVKRVVKVMGLVNCVDGFGQQPAVMNGCSNLLVDIFGDKGKHARTSVGVNALPNNIAVEIEMVVEVE